MKKIFFAVIFSVLFTSTSHAVDIGSGFDWTIRSAMDNNYVIDVTGAAKDDGTNIILYRSHGGNNQRFTITRVNASIRGPKYYRITDKNSGKVLDVSRGIAGREVNVQLWTWNRSDAQLWTFEDAGNGYVYIKNKKGYYLDVYGGRCENLANIQTYTLHGGNNQRWLLSSVAPSTFSTKTVTLGRFSTFEEWQKRMQEAEVSVIGIYPTRKRLDNKNGLVEIPSGNAIIGLDVNEYKTINVKIGLQGPGNYKTIRAELPSKVTFKLHRHDTEQKLWFDVTSFKVITKCSCGFTHTYQWDIPWQLLAPKKITGGSTYRALYSDRP